MPGNDANTKLLLHANGGDGVKSAFAHIKCNDNAASTTVTDDGSGANTFTSSTNTSNLSVAGKINEAFDFTSASSEYIDLNTLAADILTDSTGSFSFWINVGAYDGVVFSFSDSAANTTVDLQITGSKLFSFTVTGSGTTVLGATTPSNSLDPTGWYHCVIVQDDVELKIYINGVSQILTFGVAIDKGAWLDNTSGINRGRLGDRNYNGGGEASFTDNTIDDFRYFKSILSQTEIDYLYSSGSGTETSIIVDSNITSPHTEVQTFADAQLDTAQKKWGTASLLFDGTGDYLSAPDHADWDIAGSNSDNQTIDLQARFNTHVTQMGLVTQAEDASNLWRLFHSGTTPGEGLYFAVISGGTWETITGYGGGGAGDITDSNWHHIAMCKVGPLYAIYLDGAQINYGWSTFTDTFAGPLYVGQRNSDHYFDGHIDELRVQADNYFTAAPNSFPMAPFLAYCEGADEDTSMANEGYGDSITFNGTAKLDNGQTKLNSTTSLLLDGNSDYITITDTSGFDYDVVGSAGDSWTIDGFLYPNSDGNYHFVVQYEDSSNRWRIFHASSLGWKFTATSGGVGIIDTGYGGTISVSAWQHIALVKVESNYAIYIDGIQVNYTSDSSTDTYTGSVLFGQNGAAGEYFDGYMEQVQITKSNKFGAIPNVGLTSTITVPTVILIQDTITEPTEEYAPSVALGRSQAVIIA